MYWSLRGDPRPTKEICDTGNPGHTWAPEGFQKRRSAGSVRLRKGTEQFDAVFKAVSREIQVLPAAAQNVAERGFDPRTFGLLAQHAKHCATPLILNGFS